MNLSTLDEPTGSLSFSEQLDGFHFAYAFITSLNSASLTDVVASTKEGFSNSSQSLSSGDLLRFGVVVEKDEGGYYVASVPELPGCHTQAKTLDELTTRIKEAIQVYLEAEGAKRKERIELVGFQFVEVPAQ